MRLSARERQESTPMETNITRKAARVGSTWKGWRPQSRRTASQMIHTQVASSRPVSRKAEKFSNLP
jgi:hypothetical protein